MTRMRILELNLLFFAGRNPSPKYPTCQWKSTAGQTICSQLDLIPPTHTLVTFGNTRKLWGWRCWWHLQSRSRGVAKCHAVSRHYIVSLKYAQLQSWRRVLEQVPLIFKSQFWIFCASQLQFRGAAHQIRTPGESSTALVVLEATLATLLLCMHQRRDCFRKMKWAHFWLF